MSIDFLLRRIGSVGMAAALLAPALADSPPTHRSIARRRGRRGRPDAPGLVARASRLRRLY